MLNNFHTPYPKGGWTSVVKHCQHAVYLNIWQRSITHSYCSPAKNAMSTRLDKSIFQPCCSTPAKPTSYEALLLLIINHFRLIKASLDSSPSLDLKLGQESLLWQNLWLKQVHCYVANLYRNGNVVACTWRIMMCVQPPLLLPPTHHGTYRCSESFCFLMLLC